MIIPQSRLKKHNVDDIREIKFYFVEIICFLALLFFLTNVACSAFGFRGVPKNS